MESLWGCYLVYCRDAAPKDDHAEEAQIRTKFDVLTDPYNVNLGQQFEVRGFRCFGRQRQLNAVSLGSDALLGCRLLILMLWWGPCQSWDRTRRRQNIRANECFPTPESIVQFNTLRWAGRKTRSRIYLWSTVLNDGNQ